MNSEIFLNISKIIERDSKSTTYKFALLRGVIDIIQDYSPYISFSGDRAIFPTGLLIEKWILYYYPILESSENIPQINGNFNLAFQIQFNKIIKYYSKSGGFSAFYNDLKNKGIPEDLQFEFVELIKQIRNTIIHMPMKYIGRSISNDYYSIFQYNITSKIKESDVIDVGFLIENYGIFSIPLEYYKAFQSLGSFINGRDSILYKWVEFSVNASRKNLPFEEVLSKVFNGPVTERDVSSSKQIFESILRKHGNVYCVWTGNPLLQYEVDHLIPFSIWKNNDLWNLFPSSKRTNNQKRDKIPSVEMINKRRDSIFYYWDLLNLDQPVRFLKEIQISLLGKNEPKNWKETAFNHLTNSCNYLINQRGYSEWNI